MPSHKFKIGDTVLLIRQPQCACRGLGSNQASPSQRQRSNIAYAPSRTCTFAVSGHGPKQINPMRQTHRAMMMTQCSVPTLYRLDVWLGVRWPSTAFGFQAI
jgi:Flp pilus assembly protein TadG